MTEKTRTGAGWTFLTNHAHVLLCLAEDPNMRIRDLAIRIGITERAVQRILSELSDCGYVEKTRDGRTNTYVVNHTKPLKHPVESHRQISDLINLISPGESE